MKHLKPTAYLPVVLAAACLVSILAACSASHPSWDHSADSDPTPTERPQVMKLQLSVDLPAATRSEAFEDGTPGESALDVDNFDLKVFFFGADDKKTFISSAGNASFSLKRIENGKVIYQLVTTPIAGLPSDGRFRVVILANLRNQYPDPVPGITTLDEFFTASETLLFRPKAGYPGLGEGEFPMPFFGLKELDVSYDETGAFDAGIVSLLRSLVKITVSQRQNSVYTLLGVKLKNGNNRLYVSPRGVYKESDYAYPDASNPTIGENRNSALNIPPQNPTDITFAEDDGVFYAYVPEAIVDGIDEKKKPYLQLYFNEGGEDRLDFKDYTEGSTKVYDLHRNWHFNFSITKSGPMDLTVTLVPYRGVTLEPEFGFDDLKDKDNDKNYEDTYEDPNEFFPQ